MAINPLTGKPYESGTFDPKTGARTPKPTPRPAPRPSPRPPRPSGPRAPASAGSVRQTPPNPQPTARGGRRQTITTPTSTPGARMPGQPGFGTSADSQSGQTRPPAPGDQRRRVSGTTRRATDPIAANIERIARTVMTGGSPYRTTLKQTRPVGASNGTLSPLEMLDRSDPRPSTDKDPGTQAAGVFGAGFDRKQIEQAADARQNDGGWRGLLHNLGSDIGDATKAPFYLGYGTGYALGEDIKGGNLPWEKDSALRELGTETGKGIIKDYETRWGPAGTVALRSGGNPFAIGQKIAEGDSDVERAKQQLYEHPGFAAMDVAALYSSAGSATRMGARGLSRVTPKGSGFQRAMESMGERSVLPKGESIPVPSREIGPRLVPGRKSTGARARPEKRQPGKVEIIRDDAGNEIGRRVTPDATKPSRPYSKNPMTRGVQKGAGKVGRAVGSRIQTRADRKVAEGSKNKVYGYASSEARYGRLAGKDVRETVVTAAEEVSSLTERQTKERSKASRGLDGWIIRHAARRGVSPKTLNRQVNEALKHHLQGDFDQPGVTPREAHSRALARYEAENAAWKNGNRGPDGKEPITKVTDEQIALFRDLPDDLIDPAKLPAPLRRLIDEDRAVSRQSSDVRVDAGDMTPEDAQARAELPSRVVHGGARFDPNKSPVDQQIAGVRAGIKAERAKRRATGVTTTEKGVVRVARAAFGKGRGYGKAEQSLKGRPKLSATRMDPAKGERLKAIDGRIDELRGKVRRGEGSTQQLERDILRLEQARVGGPMPKGISPGQATDYGRMGARAGEQQRIVNRVREQAQSTKKIKAEQKRLAGLRAERERTKGMFSDPVRPYGDKGVYVPDIEADRRGRGGPISGESDLTRWSGETMHRNKAQLVQRNANLTDRNLAAFALDRANRSVAHKRIVDTLIERYAVRDGNGKIIREESPGRDAFSRVDPETHTIVSLRALRSVLDTSHDMPKDSFIDPAQVSKAFITPGDSKVIVPAKGDGFVVIPKSVEKALRSALNPPGSGSTILQGYDSILGTWKRGILAFAPRWYINNTLGNSTQFLLMDPKEFFNVFNWWQANRNGFREGIPARIAGGVSSDVRPSFSGAKVGVERHGRTAGALLKASDAGYHINHTLEGLWRRAAFRAKLKSSLRREGVKFSDLTPEELLDVYDAAPISFKNQVIRDFELFLGDYKRMSPTEKATLRRVFPFYSWLRVIGRLTLSLPFRHPKRTWLVSTLGREMGKVTNPEDMLESMPGYQKGRVTLGPWSFSTSSRNPLRTWDDPMAALAAGDWQGLASSLANDTSPLVSPLIQTLTGRDAFNRPFSAPKGHNGSRYTFGFGTKIDDPLGGARDYTPVPSLPELYARQIPFLPQALRGAVEAQAGMRLNDTASTIDIAKLLAGGKLGKVNSNDLFRPPSDYEPGYTPVAPGWQSLLSMLGGNPDRMNRKAILDIEREFQKRKREGEQQTNRSREKSAAKIRSGG